MPRKKKETVEEKVPVPIYEPSEYFYRAYLFNCEIPEMPLDSSGSLFAREMASAIANTCEEKTSNELISITVAEIFDPDHHPITLPDGRLTNDWMLHLFILRVKLHDKTELEKIASSDDGNNVILSLKDLEHGCSMAMQEYMIDTVEFKTNPKLHDGRIFLWKIKAHVEDVDRISRDFPPEISFKY